MWKAHISFGKAKSQSIWDMVYNLFIDMVVCDRKTEIAFV